MERLVIENFKGIKKLDLEVRPFTVLIGPQSVGKSITAKLLYYFKNIPHEALRAAVANSDKSLETALIERFKRFLPPPTRKAGKSVVRYSIGDAVFSLINTENGDSNWKIELPKAVQAEFSNVRHEVSASSSHGKDIGFALVEASYWKRVTQKLGVEFAFSPEFIPAGRSFYAQIDKDPVSFFETGTLDPFVAEFGKLFANLKHFLPALVTGQSSKLASRTAEIGRQLLSGRYEQEEQRDFIVTRDGQKLQSALWSSGQQESFPLVLYLDILCQGHRWDTPFGRNVFVEEPEAHLFPGSQRNMVELLALAFNAGERRLRLFITTHSPYVLSTLNVLLRAGQVYGNGIKRQRNGAIVTPLEALRPGSVGAYYMDQSNCHSIIDEETGLIDGSAIDDVSGELAEQLDALNELE